MDIASFKKDSLLSSEYIGRILNEVNDKIKEINKRVNLFLLILFPSIYMNNELNNFINILSNGHSFEISLILVLIHKAKYFLI